MRRAWTAVAMAIAIASALAAQTNVYGDRIWRGKFDASQATATITDRQGTGSPDSRDNCAKVGETYFQTDASTLSASKWTCYQTGSPGRWGLTAGPVGATGPSTADAIKTAIYCDDTSLSANAITCAPSGAYPAYAAGQPLLVRVKNTNTGAVTMSVAGLTAKAVVTQDIAALQSGTLSAGGEYLLGYDGTQFQLVGAASAKLNGTSVPTNSAADQALVTTASATGAWVSIANCTATGGVLQYSTSTHTFSCHTIASGDIPDMSSVYSTKTAGGDLAGTLPSPSVARVNGTTVPTNSAADQALVTTASGTGAWISIANCTAAGGVLQYSTSTHTFSCRTVAVANPAPTTLTDGATITIDASLSARYEVTLAGNRTITITNTSGAYQIVVIAYKQDATGFRVPAYSNTVDSTSSMCNLWPAPGTVTTQFLQVTAAGTIAGLGCISPMVFGSESSAPTALQCPLGIGCVWWDTVLHNYMSRQNGSSLTLGMLNGINQPFDSNVVLWTGKDGSQNRGPVRPNRSVLRIEEEFMVKLTNSLGSHNWSFSGSSGVAVASVAATTSAPSTKGHPGIIGITTGSVSGNAGYTYLASGSGTSLWTSLGSASDFTGGWYSGASVLLEPAANSGTPTASATAGYCFAFANSNASFPGLSATGIGICADTSSPITCTTGTWSATNWNYVSSNSSGNTATTCVDSGVAANSATWYDFDISSTTLGTVNFQINGAGAATISTNVPSVAGYPEFVVYTRTSATKTLWVDYFYFLGTTLGRSATTWPN